MPTDAITSPALLRATRRGPLNGASQEGRSEVCVVTHSPRASIVGSTAVVDRNTPAPKRAGPVPRIAPSSSPSPARSGPSDNAAATASAWDGGTAIIVASPFPTPSSLRIEPSQVGCSRAGSPTTVMPSASGGHWPTHSVRWRPSRCSTAGYSSAILGNITGTECTVSAL